MNSETIIKREDGTQYQITVSTYLDSYMRGSITYNVSLRYKEKGKRKWLEVPDTLSDWEYRNLDMDARREHTYTNMLRFVSKEELYSAKLDLWGEFKPEV